MIGKDELSMKGRRDALLGGKNVECIKLLEWKGGATAGVYGGRNRINKERLIPRICLYTSPSECVIESHLLHCVEVLL